MGWWWWQHIHTQTRWEKVRAVKGVKEKSKHSLHTFIKHLCHQANGALRSVKSAHCNRSHIVEACITAAATTLGTTHARPASQRAGRRPAHTPTPAHAVQRKKAVSETPSCLASCVPTAPCWSKAVSSQVAARCAAAWMAYKPHGRCPQPRHHDGRHFLASECEAHAPSLTENRSILVRFAGQHTVKTPPAEADSCCR
jgi:hypothetical protein